jgi:hypothetical protein
MSFRAKRELLVQVALRYRAARHGERTAILDEFIAVTGYDRKYAIRVLLGPIQPPAPIRRPRRAYYGREVQEALASAWLAANGSCAKRLVPFLVELIPTLERHGHLSLTDEVREQVLTLSSATADRLLRPLRHPHGLTTTKPGRLLKKQIPIRTFTEWNDVQPGFLEGDLVAHCGGSLEGAFLYTFTLTDVATTWTECLPLLHRTQQASCTRADPMLQAATTKCFIRSELNLSTTHRRLPLKPADEGVQHSCFLSPRLNAPAGVTFAAGKCLGVTRTRSRPPTF